MARCTRHTRGGRPRRTYRTTKRNTRKLTKRSRKSSRKSHRKSKRSRRKGMGPGDKMSKMTVSQQFMLRSDLREARKRMTIEEFRSVLKTIDALDTEAEQLKELAKLGKPFYKPPKGRWTTDYTRGDSKFWCPHGLTCLTEDECDDFQEHLEAKGRD